VVIADVRRPTEHFGFEVRAARGGRVPGSINVLWRENLNEDWTFKSAEEIRARHEAVGITPDREVITYCQAGVRAAHAAIALRMAGYPNVRIYDGSWADWGNDPEVPIERG
jgi:thiosulfate/3-mercaptopyruvate sulfurtransferase